MVSWDTIAQASVEKRLARQEKTQIFAEKQSPCPGPTILSDPDSSCSSPSGNSSGDEFPTTPKRPRTEQVGCLKFSFFFDSQSFPFSKFTIHIDNRGAFTYDVSSRGGRGFRNADGC